MAEILSSGTIYFGPPTAKTPTLTNGERRLMAKWPTLNDGVRRTFTTTKLRRVMRDKSLPKQIRKFAYGELVARRAA